MQSAGVEQSQQFAPAVQRHQVITTTHMGLANKNLRYRAAPRNFRHLLTLAGKHIDANFIEFDDAALLKQLFRLDAVGAGSGGVNLDSLHWVRW